MRFQNPSKYHFTSTQTFSQVGSKSIASKFDFLLLLGLSIIFYTAHGHKLRFFRVRKAQSVTVGIIANLDLSNQQSQERQGFCHVETKKVI
jgi:hypothetical protein